MALSIQVTCYRERKFGALSLNMTVEDFNDLGFVYGDSVDIEVSNGSRFEDIPYYSGFYCNNGEIILTGNHWYPNVVACISQGGSLWDEIHMQEGDSITVILRERGKYRVVQEALCMEYSNNREDYASDVVFANFRALTGGRIRKNTYYRGASPCCDQCGRAYYGEKMCRDTLIRCALNLCDDAEHMERFLKQHDLPYYQALYEEGNVFPMGMNTNYSGYEFSHVLGEGLMKMTEKEGPFYIHCLEGKDRTGFACMLLLSLAGASLDEILEDYMITYDNYYGINRNNEAEKYDAVLRVKALDHVKIISGRDKMEEVTVNDLMEGAKRYLIMGGLTPEQVETIQKFITE